MARKKRLTKAQIKKRENIKRQNYLKQIGRDKISSISLEEVESDKGVKIDD